MALTGIGKQMGLISTAKVANVFIVWEIGFCEQQRLCLHLVNKGA